MSVVVVSNVFGVFGTPFAAQPNPTSSIAAPTGTATSSANHHIVRDTQPLWACLASGDEAVNGFARGIDQRSTADAAVSDCNSLCNVVECTQGGCVAEADDKGPAFYGAATGSGLDAVQRAITAAHNSCFSSQESCPFFTVVCS
jgi:hypothetical protein